MGNWDGWVIEKVYLVDKDDNVLSEVKPFTLKIIDDDEEVCKNNKDNKQEEC